MTREEFNKVLSEESHKEVTKLIKTINDTHYENQNDLIVDVLAASISGTTNIILSALEKAGVLKYDN